MMKKISILLFCTLVFVGCEKDPAQTAIDGVFAVMDDEGFKWYCSRFDTNKDGKLSLEEASTVTTIDVSARDIKSLKGIEYFTALTELVCFNNNLSRIDLSKNRNLTYLWCHNNKLASLDISNNTALISLYCYGNPNLMSIYVWVGFDLVNPINSIGYISKDNHSNFVIKLR